MVSLWGNKKDNARPVDDGERRDLITDEDDGASPRVSREEPNERTRLIVHHPPQEGYLDPDDPAVSPNNLWIVRVLRYFATIFLVVNFLWWTLLLVSIFVSPPGMHSRGSGFFDFSYSTLTAGYLLLSLLFFTYPSKAMEVNSIIIALLLLVDMIIILAVPRLRVEEGWVGIAAVVWSTVMAIYNVITNRVVTWGKAEEEERLTGRHETRRSVKEWLAVLVSTIVMVVMILVTILLTATLILRARDASLEAPGEKFYVDGAKYQVHVACFGNNTSPSGKDVPTVLIEAGEENFEYTLQPFIENAYANGSIARYCYWDRPGKAFSDNAPSPHSAGMSAGALSEALAIKGEAGPWILVSAGIGGIYSRIFSSRNLDSIEGIMLIDTLHEDLLYRIGDKLTGFQLWVRGVLSPLGLDRIPAALFKGRTREDRVYGRSAYQSGKFIKASLQENLVAQSLTANEISQARILQSRTDGKNVPLVVVSSGVECARDSEWKGKQQDLTTVTDNLVAWDVVKKAGHKVWETYEGREVIEKRLRGLVMRKK